MKRKDKKVIVNLNETILRTFVFLFINEVNRKLPSSLSHIELLKQRKVAVLVYREILPLYGQVLLTLTLLVLRRAEKLIIFIKIES